MRLRSFFPVKKLWGVLAALIVSTCAGGSVFAQTIDNGALKAEAELLFKQMLVRPDNLDAAFKFSEIETQLGDYEAAIGALERMLFYNNQLPRVKLELGLLYFKLGSYETARSYFASVRDLPDAPFDVRQRVDTFIAEIDRRANVHQFSVFLQTGLRSQTNANAGPANALVRAAGADAILSNQFLRRRDSNWFALGTARHVYDFENQRGDVWETNLTSYYARQFSITRLNLGLVEIDTGPRFALGATTGLSVRPYALGSDITLGDRQYLGSAGGGGQLGFRTLAGAYFETGVEYRNRQFSNSTNYPNASLQRGDQVIGSFSTNGPIPFVSGLRWQGRVAATRASANDKAYSYDQVSADLSFPFEFDGFFGQAGRKWTLAPFAGLTFTRYDRPNPVIDPNLNRRDRETRFGATLDMQFYEGFGFASQVAWSKVSSTIPNFRTQNFIVSGGPTFRF